jgi:uncharacterized repeat protein (TIGR01451 family)
MMTLAPSVEINQRYQGIFNGMNVLINSDEISSLFGIAGVKNVYPDRMQTILLDSSIQVINTSAIWADVGGQEQAGRGIKIAVIDTGIYPKNPMFDDSGFSLPAGGYPAGYCASNPSDPDFQCNAKLIASRYYTPTFTTHISETLTPLDIVGHGTHVAGIAAGRQVEVPPSETVPVSTTITGVAPAAYIMAYKVFFLDPQGTAMGSDAMVLAALDDALLDGADVINNSWGSSAGADPSGSPYLTVIQALHAAGIVLVFGAGNDGPEGSTINCPGCVEETIAVAASTANRIYANTLDMTGPGVIPPDLTGLGVMASTGPAIQTDIEGNIRYAGIISATNSEGCLPFPSEVLSDSIALIQRGTCSFATKVNNASAAGAIATVVINDRAGAPVVMGSLESTTIPSVLMSIDDGEAVRDWISGTMTTTARINAEVTAVVNTSWQDILAEYSSVGPNGDPDVLKPDLTAPGVQILSATSPVTNNGDDYKFMGGTSAAAPHVSGAAAMLLQMHPNWNPDQVKTALTSTSRQGLQQYDGVTPANAFNIGAGRIDLDLARQTGVTFSRPSFANGSCRIACDWSDIKIENVTGITATWTATILPPDGMDVTITPVSQTLTAGSDGSFDLRVDASLATQDQWHFGSIVWSESSGTYPDAVMPIAIYPEAVKTGRLVKTTSADLVPPGGTLEYTITLTNDTPVTTTYSLSDSIPVNGTYIPGTATGGLSYDPVEDVLTATVELTNTIMKIEHNSLYGYISLASGLPAPVPPFPCPDTNCDDSAILLSGLDFQFNGQQVNDIVWHTNGYIQVDTKDADLTPGNQELPAPEGPNNILAPLWADLDLDGGDGIGGGTLYMAPVTDGVHVYTVLEWENAQLKGDPSSHFTFQVWIRNGSDDIWFTYDTMTGNLDQATVGIENVYGNVGASFYYNGSGTAPAKGTSLKILTIPDSVTFTYEIEAAQLAKGEITNIVEATNTRNNLTLRAETRTGIRSSRIWLPMILMDALP